MKMFYFILIGALQLHFGLGQICAQNSEATTYQESEIKITGRAHKIGETLKLEFTLVNISDHDVYITTDPVQLFGNRGYYLFPDKADNSILNISSCLFPMPPFYPYANKTSVVLKKLKSGEQRTDKLILKFPTKETSPPYDRPSLNISLPRLKRIKLSVGYVTGKGAEELLGSRVKGDEALLTEDNKSETLFSIQRVSSFELTIDES